MLLYTQQQAYRKMKFGEKHNDTKKNPIPKNKQNKKC